MFDSVPIAKRPRRHLQTRPIPWHVFVLKAYSILSPMVAQVHCLHGFLWKFAWCHPTIQTRKAVLVWARAKNCLKKLCRAQNLVLCQRCNHLANQPVAEPKQTYCFQQKGLCLSMAKPVVSSFVEKRCEFGWLGELVGGWVGGWVGWLWVGWLWVGGWVGWLVVVVVFDFPYFKFFLLATMSRCQFRAWQFIFVFWVLCQLMSSPIPTM